MFNEVILSDLKKKHNNHYLIRSSKEFYEVLGFSFYKRENRPREVEPIAQGHRVSELEELARQLG